MNKKQALAILMLLSALESWAYSTGKPFPDFLNESLKSAIETLKQLIVGDL